jgi:hypothetical protein
LAFWTGPDPRRIDRLFRQSGLYRDKWERADYRETTIGLALSGLAFWEPGMLSPTNWRIARALRLRCGAARAALRILAKRR